jgi:N-acyl homoserine lactone hydrolase
MLSQSDLRLYFFTCGRIRCKTLGLKMNEPLGAPLEIPVPWFVIQHPKGNVVIDGGMAVECASDPRSRLSQAFLRGYEPMLTEEQGCLPALQSLGIDPGSIRYVLLSHLHWDHTGAVGRFPNAIHFVQRRELEYALVPDWFAVDAFARSDFDVPGLAWHLLEGSEADAYDLFGDGTVRIILTPGHSVAHQSFLITLPKTGAVLLTIDAAYTMEHWEEKALPSFATSTLEAARSVRKLRQIARSTDALVVTGHYPIAWPTFRHAPAYYD